jgi:HK97 family phage major capsid protein
VVNQDMASIGASAKSVLFGDFQNYIIRYAGPDRFKVLTERYAETDQIALVLITRLDGQLIDAGTNPIKYLIHAAS